MTDQVHSRSAEEAARRQLDRIRQRRDIDEAHRRGEPAGDTARRLGLEIGEVEELRSRLEAHPERLARRPKEVIEEFVVGELSRGQLVPLLIKWPYTFGRLIDYDAREPGSWDDVEAARSMGLIDDELFAEVARNAYLPTGVFPRWVSREARTPQRVGKARKSPTMQERKRATSGKLKKTPRRRSQA